MPRLRRTPVFASLMVGVASGTARADATDVQLREARQTFVQAEADEDGERWSDALDKLRAVSRVKDTAGVRYHVALCEEHLGRLAQALADYQSASSRAALDNAHDVIRLVGKQLATLEPRVPRLTVRLLPDVPDASVRVDGLPARAGDVVRLDPGRHTVEVVASGRATSTADVTLREYESTILGVTLSSTRPAPASAPVQAVAPALGSAPVQAVAPALASAPIQAVAPEPSSALHSGGHALAVVVSLLTAALAGGGAAAYAMAGAEDERSVTLCATVVSPKADACDALKGRVRAWDFGASGLWAAAIGAAAVSVVLWTTDRNSGVSAAVVAGPNAVALTGRF